MKSSSFGRLALGLILASAFAPSSVAQSDGPLVCTLSRATECGESYDCAPPQANPDVPRFIHVDAGNDTVTLLDPESRRGETSVIRAKSNSETSLVASGIDGNRVWSLVVDHADRSLTLTLADEEAGFIAFGHCIAADKLAPPE